MKTRIIRKNYQKKSFIRRFWDFLQEDSWLSWLVSIVLIVFIVRGLFFPALSWVTGTSLPLVIVESCSMYHHESSLTDWWASNKDWYLKKNITYDEFNSFKFKGGLNKGDIIFVWGKGPYKIGDIIIFNAGAAHPIIHRMVYDAPIETKGESIHNTEQIHIIGGVDETNINKESIVGKAALRIPYLGWIKLVFFEPFRTPDQRGFCS